MSRDYFLHCATCKTDGPCRGGDCNHQGKEFAAYGECGQSYSRCCRLPTGHQGSCSLTPPTS